MDPKALIYRGSVDVIVKDELDKLLGTKKFLRIKYGIDPTAGRIHIGRAATMRHLKHFQELGHKIDIVIGSFTATIGDSSDKEAERQALTPEEVKSNMASYEAQLGRIFDVAKAKIHYNGEWFDDMPLQEFLGLQQLFSVSQMLERDNFAKRYASESRIGLHELSYPLLQGYDSVKLQTDVEIGGTDQLFNLLAGRTVQKHYAQTAQSIITYELLPGLDGRKMSTSWGNCIYVDDEPAEMYGKVMSIADALMWDYYRISTEITDEELAQVKQQIDSGDDPRALKARLALEITKLYHGEAAAAAAETQFNAQFKGGELPEGIEDFKTELGEREVSELLTEAGLVDTKSEARRQLDQNGVRLNQKKVSAQTITVQDGDIISVGKRRFKRIRGV